MDWSFAAIPIPVERRRFFEESTSQPVRIGRYEIRGTLGVGGMGIVYRATDPSIGRDVALKVINPSKVTPETLKRFQSEITNLGKINHPRIAVVYEAGRYRADKRSKLPFFSMELVADGSPVVACVKKHALGPMQRYALVKQIAEAIAAAHALGIPHLDISSSNVLAWVTPGAAGPEPQAKVVDFGLAVDLRQGTELHDWGKEQYAAPERFRSSAVDAFRCDVFSLGVLAFEILACEGPALRRDESDVASESVSIEKAIKGLPKSIATVIRRATKREPGHRYKNAGEFLEDLQNAAAGRLLAPETENPTPWLKTLAFCRVNRGPVIAGALIFLALAGGTVISVLQAREAERQRDIARLRAIEAERARAVAEALRLSTDNAMRFLEAGIFGADSYNVRDQVFSVDVLMRQAEANLSLLQGDRRALAIAKGALGRIASNWGNYSGGQRWLAEAAEAWRACASLDGSEVALRDQRALAQVLNHLAWAIMEDHTVEAGRSGRAKAAVPVANEAYQLIARTTAPDSEDVIAFGADALRMRQWAGDKESIKGWIQLLAMARRETDGEFVEALVRTIKASAQLASSGRAEEGKAEMEKFLGPFLEPQRPRLRGRTPWAVAQAAKELRAFAVMLPLLPFVVPEFRQLGDVQPEELRTVAPVMLALAADLASGMFPSGHPNTVAIRRMIEESNAW